MNIRKVNIKDYNSVINLYKQLYDVEKVFDDNLIDEYKVDEIVLGFPKNMNDIKKKILKK